MKQSIKLKTTTLLVIPLVLACFALLPRAQAATPELLPAPAPDGFYNGFNTAEGFQALFNVNIAVGTFNTALGFKALRGDTSGAHNTAVGAQALLNNNLGSFNTAVGENALVFNTTGSMNMALGQGALASNVLGSFNTAMGFQALNSNNTDDNTAVGFRALAVNSTGDDNTATGITALESNTIGFNNTALGGQTLLSNTASGNNTAVGWNALEFSNADPTGDPSTAVGSFALQHNTIGLKRSRPTSMAAPTMPLVTLPSRKTTTARATMPSVILRSLAPREMLMLIRPSVMKRGSTLPAVMAIPLSAKVPAKVSVQPITLFVSAETSLVRTRATGPISAI